MSDNQIFITEITEEHIITSLIEECATKQVRVEIAVGDQKYPTKFSGKFFSSFKEMEIIAPDNVTLSAGQNYKATVFADNQVFGMVVQFIKQEVNQLIVSYPSKFFKINRREAFRFKIPSAYEIPVTVVVDNQSYEGRLFDLSLDGAGIWFRTQPNFKSGQNIQQVFFKLDNKEIYSLGEIKVCFPLENQKVMGVKIGVKMLKMEHQCQTHIMNYMNRHLSQYAKKIA